MQRFDLACKSVVSLVIGSCHGMTRVEDVRHYQVKLTAVPGPYGGGFAPLLLGTEKVIAIGRIISTHLDALLC